MFERIKEIEESLDDIERRDEDSQLDILIGRGWKDKTEIRKIVLDYMNKADRERRRLLNE